METGVMLSMKLVYNIPIAIDDQFTVENDNEQTKHYPPTPLTRTPAQLTLPYAL
jgi:hypothetical protein